MDEKITELLNIVQGKLTLEGKKRVFEEGRELGSDDLISWQDPEEFTREYLIDKILFEVLKLEKTGPKNFKTDDETPRKVDYAVQHEKNKILIEAKPINADLHEKSSHGAINQIKGLFRLADAKEQYDFGIATNGMKWIFINRQREIIDELDLISDFNQIKSYMKIKKHIPQRKREDIGKEFYKRYNDILHGTEKISEKDCFVNSINHVDDVEDCEEIAQLTINRLIFIKFLHERGLMKSIKRDWDIFEFIKQLPPYEVNAKLQELFFNVMNKQKKDRLSLFDVTPLFYDIPYLNGSLFVKNEVEQKNPEYSIDAKILIETIKFLDDFKFMSVEDLKKGEDAIDPEILGYIFERSMTANDRKGTGAYYTPKEITEYIAENTIFPVILDKSNKFLMKDKGYKNTELLNKIDDLFILPATTLSEIWNKIILNLTICDNACGSGAFILAAANVLFKLNRKIDDKLGLNNSDISLKKLIFKSLYGVDINSRGIEIALLRLWLWLAESYDPEHIEPLPNIEYNLRVGNSLVGYVDIEQFETNKLSLDDFENADETIRLLLNRFRKIKAEYRKSIGDDARRLRNEIEEIRDKINKRLDVELYRELNSKKIKIDKEHFLELKPFHWGFEFYEDFNLEIPKEERGFDIVIGNPPYGTSIKGNYREILTEMIDKVPDYEIYYLFINRSRNIIKKSSLFSYIIPNSILYNVFAGEYRLKFVTDWNILDLLDCSNFQIFSEPTIRNMIFFIKKEESLKKLGYHKTDLIENFQDLINQPRKFAEYKDILLFNQNWSLLFKLDDKIIDIINHIKSDSKELISLFPNISQGLIAYDKYKGQETEIIESRTYHYLEKSKPELKKWLWGEDIKRYSVEWNNKEYIDYCEGIANPRQPFFFKDSRILVREITNPSIYAGYTEEEAYNDPSIIIVHSKDSNFPILSLLGILNSKLATFFHFNYSPKAIKGAFPKILVQDIKQFPIKQKTKQNEEYYIELEKLVENRVHHLKNTNIDLDNKIDEIVYKIYGLTKEEIAIIEESIK